MATKKRKKSSRKSPLRTRAYRLNNGIGGVSVPIPSLAGAYRLAEKIVDLPSDTFVEVFDPESETWQKTGPKPRQKTS